MLKINKRPYIKFRYRKDLEGLSKPQPAIKLLPDWYKKLSRTIKGNHKNSNGTVKRCIPVLEACGNGYIIPAWCDFTINIKVKGKKAGVFVSTPSNLGFSYNTITNHTWNQVGDDCPIKHYPLGKVLLKFSQDLCDPDPLQLESLFNHINSVHTVLLWMIVQRDIDVRMENLVDSF